ncbi:helix-turn-helix domain-containing protein [Streptomyces sp. NPDC058620]|uniref:helix-turn-helix domain-containing protein n=1 Tax=Streptomyces sp. NPDC058620 TaxID=3346560 RepID=UPI003664AE94
MTNYDAGSEEVEARHQAAAERTSSAVRRSAAVENAVDEVLDPKDPYENAVTGQLGDDVDSETLASWNLRRIRQVLKLSQQQVCDKLAELPGRSRLSQSQLAKIERGERPWRVNEMFDLAEALGVEYFDFFSDQMGTDERSMKVLAARLRYQRAIHAADEAERLFQEALKEQFDAGLKLVHTSAYLGVKDGTALSVLAGQAEIADEVAETLQEIGMPAAEALALPHVQAKRANVPYYDRRQKMAAEWAEEEWERLAAEVRKTEERLVAHRDAEAENERAE